MHPWHDVELGRKFPKVTTAVIEIPMGTNTKYKVDPKTGLLKLSNCLPTVARYPANYGFFPRTITSDGDALDVFVFGREPVFPLSIMEVRVLGGAETKSKKKGKELKMIAVSPDDSEYEDVESLDGLPAYYLDQLTQFFETYRELEGDVRKLVKYFSRSKAHDLIRAGAKDYSKQAARGSLR
jgi:inorganic pyrophosphatase